MSRKRTALTEEQITELQVAYDQCRDGDTKIRFLAVRLYGTGKEPEEILSTCGCSRSSLMNWNREYRALGIAGLVDKRTGGNSAKLTSYQLEDLSERLDQYTPEQLLGPSAVDGQFWNIQDLAALVKREYKVVYKSSTSYRTLLKRCGLSRQRPAKQYKSRSEIKVMVFEENFEKN